MIVINTNYVIYIITMEEYSSPDNILPIFYFLIFVFSFMCFTTCCGYLLYKKYDSEDREKQTRVYPVDLNI